MTDYLMRIVVNEQQQEKKEQTYKAILSYLWEQGAPGATMRRGDAGIDNEGSCYLQPTFVSAERAYAAGCCVYCR